MHPLLGKCLMVTKGVSAQLLDLCGTKANNVEVLFQTIYSALQNVDGSWQNCVDVVLGNTAVNGMWEMEFNGIRLNLAIV